MIRLWSLHSRRGGSSTCLFFYEGLQDLLEAVLRCQAGVAQVAAFVDDVVGTDESVLPDSAGLSISITSLFASRSQYAAIGKVYR